ncbi:MAG: serine O-acetyltransferase [candidate division Zixibacteria bacterium]|nr:serine O-acetyltransferase [candidate division Zixibacteria bacterium]MDH3938231.1 serine O-acetyltransferase [candidate division Zixibacteria bacterium]MDH4033296.1 serine O-acetyltransferase [candidate division Zixibacteria bacterium]
MSIILDDIRAIYRNDPAVRNIEFLLYPGFQATLAHRLIHLLWKLRIPFVPRLLSQVSRFVTGLEIHPGATIGRGFFVDHGAGVVIGETTVIGDNCVLFHNVTLGGTGKHHGKRHPTVGSNVFIGTGATLLGPIEVGDNVKIGANTFVVMRDIPSNCSVVGTPARIIKRNGIQREEELPKTIDRLLHEESLG